ncbi:putative TIR domain-containing protein [Helianthus annuus]|nr:putative TIR domain-containing protein [Helianthus annuus]
MASSSLCTGNKSYLYDVFLSFSGEDTRKTFVDHLYAALDQHGIPTFKDDERLQKGKKIDDELLRSIEDSRFYIIVFSKRYASSSWCLNELLKIMECHNTNELTAFPVFYDVEPSEVRKQTGSVGEAIAVHKNTKMNQRLENGEGLLQRQPICLVGM